jgi:hypothetical protein
MALVVKALGNGHVSRAARHSVLCVLYIIEGPNAVPDRVNFPFYSVVTHSDERVNKACLGDSPRADLYPYCYVVVNARHGCHRPAYSTQYPDLDDKGMNDCVIEHLSKYSKAAGVNPALKHRGWPADN